MQNPKFFHIYVCVYIYGIVHIYKYICCVRTCTNTTALIEKPSEEIKSDRNRRVRTGRSDKRAWIGFVTLGSLKKHLELQERGSERGRCCRPKAGEAAGRLCAFRSVCLPSQVLLQCPMQAWFSINYQLCGWMVFCTILYSWKNSWNTDSVQ